MYIYIHKQLLSGDHGQMEGERNLGRKEGFATAAVTPNLNLTCHVDLYVAPKFAMLPGSARLS